MNSLVSDERLLVFHNSHNEPVPESTRPREILFVVLFEKCVNSNGTCLSGMACERTRKVLNADPVRCC